ncbi:hypothetical protein GJ744_003254 [Endocarpon pusillum]|uniref:Uncharacterized protein n=1 Tax=Endocarpon pusillum TaxID=364733 RepID=A0A8H7A819_9EURO|nr:hypothetical protein GJ744_003254 [Endocarpon pusillum]
MNWESKESIPELDGRMRAGVFAMFFSSGQEMIVDAVKVNAQTAFSQCTTVVLQE